MAAPPPPPLEVIVVNGADCEIDEFTPFAP
jgi:hypothetical protein